MTVQASDEDAPAIEGPPRKKANHPLARVWRRVRGPLAQSGAVKGGLVALIAGGMRLTKRTNRLVEGSVSLEDVFSRSSPAIYALWHGQHILAPALNPRWHRVVAMFSRSADAELNALVAERMGLETVRGSGGRELDRAKTGEKGGVRALIALKKALEEGKSVCMIADIPHGTPRQAGMGIVTLARISGRPIVGLAMATSRRKVIEKSWDKTTVNLPFGRMAITATAPITVGKDAGEDELEILRAELTMSLNEATERAYALVDGRP